MSGVRPWQARGELPAFAAKRHLPRTRKKCIAMKKTLAAAAILATGLLGGCVAYPYGDPYYGAPGYYAPGYYAPGYVGGTIYFEGGADGPRHHRHRGRR